MIWFSSIQTIQIIDWEEYEIYEYGIDNGKIFTKNRYVIGYYEDWYDDNNIIDKQFKNKDNYVVDTNTGEVLQKFVIDTIKLLHQIKLGTYAKFTYDYENDRLIFTDTIRYIA